MIPGTSTSMNVQEQNSVSQDQLKQNIEQRLQNKLKRQRELSKMRCRRYREKKRLCTEKTIHNLKILLPSNCNPPPVIEIKRTTISNSQSSETSINMNVQQQNLVSQNEINKQSDGQIQQNRLEQQRELATENSTSKKQVCSEKTIHNLQIPWPSNCNPPPVIGIQSTTTTNSQIDVLNKRSIEQIQQNKLKRQRELAKERNRRYRQKKRFCAAKIIHDSQISESSNCDPALVMEIQRTSTLNSQISETSINMNVQQQNLVSLNESNEPNDEQIQQNKLQQKRKLTRERCRRYRERKRLGTFEHLEYCEDMKQQDFCYVCRISFSNQAALFEHIVRHITLPSIVVSRIDKFKKSLHTVKKENQNMQIKNGLHSDTSQSIVDIKTEFVEYNEDIKPELNNVKTENEIEIDNVSFYDHIKEESQNIQINGCLHNNTSQNVVRIKTERIEYDEDIKPGFNNFHMNIKTENEIENDDATFFVCVKKEIEED